MLALFINGILILSGLIFLIVYYNYIARFHRIHLFGHKVQKTTRYARFLPVFRLQDSFKRKEDRLLFQMLRLRKLPVVVCLGDSITHGIISTNYVEMLQEKYNGKFLFVNSGINGNLAYNLKNRLLSDCIDLDPDYITILIGTNDVNSHKDEQTMKNYLLFQRLPQRPDLAFYEANLREIITTLQQQTRAKIAILSLPVIGEEFRSKLNLLAIEYIRIIQTVAEEYHLKYLALNEAQHSLLQSIPNRNPGQPRRKRVLLNFLLMMGRSFDRIAAIHNRYLTYDDLHETGRGAAQIVDLISDWLDGK